MENIKILCAPGYPVSGGTVASEVKAAHQVKAVAFQRGRFMATGVNVMTPTIADLPSDLSAMTSERIT